MNLMPTAEPRFTALKHKLHPAVAAQRSKEIFVIVQFNRELVEQERICHFQTFIWPQQKQHPLCNARQHLTDIRHVAYQSATVWSV